MGNVSVVLSLVLLLLLDLESVDKDCHIWSDYSLHFVVSILFIKCEFVGVRLWVA